MASLACCRTDGTSYGDCRAEIIFYDPEELTPVEIDKLKQYVERKRAEVAKDVVSRDIVLCTKQYFIEKFLFPHIEAENLIVGFNLPFDLSRLAAEARPATKLNEGWSLMFNYTDQTTGEVKLDRIRRIKITRKDGNVAANRHPGQVGYSHSPPQEVRDEESSLRADPGKEGQG